MSPSDCKNPEIGKRIAHYEAGLLDEADRSRFEEHLLECDFCVGEVERMFPVATALLANRDRIREGLAEDGITFDALRNRLAPAARRNQRRGVLAPVGERLLGLRQTLKRPPVLWTALGTAVAMILVVVTFQFVGQPTESPSGSRCVPFLSFQALPYEGSLTLRGEEARAGKEDFDKGMEAYLQADYQRAARYLRAAVGKSSDQAEWWLYLGVCSYLQRDAKRAIQSLGRADELAQGRVKLRARWFLAQTYLLAGDRDRAEPLLEWIVAQKRDYSQDATDLLNHVRTLGSAGGSNDRPSVESPGGGEVFLTGSTITVVWSDEQYELAKQYQIWLSTDGGVTFPKLLVSGLANSETEWDWEHADVMGDHLSVRVNAVRDEAIIQGAGSRPFGVALPPQITVRSPQGGERWRFGIANTISWSAVGTAPVSYAIELYREDSSGAAMLETLVSDLPGSSASWVWKDTRDEYDLPAPGGGFRVKVIGQFSGGQIAAWNDGRYSLAPPASVSVDAVTNEENGWFEGDDIPLAWQSSQEGVKEYTLQLCWDVASAGTTLATHLPGDASNWTWTRAGPPGSYLIRVIGHYPEGDVAGYSPSSFEIHRRTDERRTAMAGAGDVARPAANHPSLDQNYPNPFNAMTTISFDLRSAGNVRLSVYNTLGQQVALLIDGSLAPGRHQAQFDGGHLASGVYIYRLEAAGQVVQKQMLLTK
jgi:tetratricopeptide (TPR) repeat protein